MNNIKDGGPAFPGVWFNNSARNAAGRGAGRHRRLGGEMQHG